MLTQISFFFSDVSDAYLASFTTMSDDESEAADNPEWLQNLSQNYEFLSSQSGSDDTVATVIAAHQNSKNNPDNLFNLFLEKRPKKEHTRVYRSQPYVNKKSQGSTTKQRLQAMNDMTCCKRS